jgi:ATP-binding cassette, subfamily B, multidrug efflux pump
MTPTTSREGLTTEQRLRAFHEEAVLGKAYDAELLKRLWPFVKPHSSHLVVSIGVLLVVAAMNLARPLVMGAVVKHAANHDRDGLFRDGLVLTALVIVTQLLGFAQLYQMQLAGARAMADMRETVFRFLQRLTLRFFDRTPVGRLVTRATNDVDALGELFAQGVLNAIGDLVSLVGYVIAMALLDWQMSLIAFAALPIVLAIVTFVRKRSREAFRDIRAKTARLNAFLGEQVNGIAVVQAYGREQATEREFDVINDAYRDANKRSIYYEAILDAAIEMVATLCIASVLLWVALNRPGARADSAAAFALVVTFTSYIKQFFEPISMLSQRYTILQSAMAGAERIFQLLDQTDVELDTLPEHCAEDRAGEALSFEHVTFEYKPGAPVLRDVTFKAAPGEKIALVGATGSGKTTIASLLLRLYEIKEGVARVAERDIRRYKREELRQAFAVVPQDVYLFPGTLLTNVAMSDATPDRDRARLALERVGAASLFERRSGKDWLDAPVDERGGNFSAGERQLIAFARALYRDAPMIILDEATASVDSDTEARLQKALDAVLEGRTAVVIAHRLSTIKAADRIIVLHKGVVVEQGTHEELLAKGGFYAKLHRLQFAAA